MAARSFAHTQHQLHPFTNYNWESAPFTLRAINNVCAKCINSFPSVEETISLRGNKEGKPEVGVETTGGREERVVGSCPVQSR